MLIKEIIYYSWMVFAIPILVAFHFYPGLLSYIETFPWIFTLVFLVINKILTSSFYPPYMPVEKEEKASSYQILIVVISVFVALWFFAYSIKRDIIAINFQNSSNDDAFHLVMTSLVFSLTLLMYRLSKCLGLRKDYLSNLPNS